MAALVQPAIQGPPPASPRGGGRTTSTKSVSATRGPDKLYQSPAGGRRRRWRPGLREGWQTSLMTLPATSRTAGRPPRLSRQVVIDRAEAILTSEGIEALTMRRLARDLGSSPMALYGYVHDKEELLIALLDRRAAELPRPALPDDPRGRLLVLYGLLFESLSNQPWIVPVLMKGDLSAPSIFGTVDAILGAFLAAGLPPEPAAAAYHVAWRYTVGELSVRQASAERRAALSREPLITTLQRRADPTDFPHLAALGGPMAAAREGLKFQVGLAAVIDGLLAWRDPS